VLCKLRVSAPAPAPSALQFKSPAPAALVHDREDKVYNQKMADIVRLNFVPKVSCRETACQSMTLATYNFS
jgi:hypothetical protein